MKRIQIQVEDDKFNDFMVIIRNLKEGLIKKIEVNDEIEFVGEEEQVYYEALIQNMNNRDEEVSSSETAEI